MQEMLDIAPRMNAEEYLAIIEAAIDRVRVGDIGADTGYLDNMLLDLHHQIVKKGGGEPHAPLLMQVREASERLHRRKMGRE